MLRRLIIALFCLVAVVVPARLATAFTQLGPEGEPVPSTAAPDDTAEPPGEPYWGQERISGKYIPDDLGVAPRPLVVLLHGYGQSIETVMAGVPVIRAAYEHGWVLVAPSGLTDGRGWRYWNATPGCCGYNRIRNDDVGYLRGVIEAHLARYPIDPDRVVVVGLSNGGFMAYRLACEAADLVSAVVVVSGSQQSDPDRCSPSRPVSVYHIHGTADRAVFFTGGLLGVAPQVYDPYYSAPEVVAGWARHNRCPATDPTPVSVPSGSGGEWTGCEDGTTVQYRWLSAPHRITITDELVSTIGEFIFEHERDPAHIR